MQGRTRGLYGLDMGGRGEGMGLGEGVQLGVLLHLSHRSVALVGLGLDVFSVEEGGYDEDDPGEGGI